MSQAKLDKLVGPSLPASREEIIKAGAAPGYASPIGLREALIIVDDLIPQSLNLVVGANEPGYHLLNANYGRDFTAAIVQDVTLAQPNDPCPRCGSALEGAATTIVADRAGIHSRSVLTVFADKFQDDRGLCLPPLIAPFDVYLIQLASKNVDTRGPAGALYETLEASGLEVLYDDRDERAGVKFTDADLIGCPVRLTVGEKGLRDGMVEFKRRSQTEIEVVKTSEATDHILKVLRDADA